MSLDQYDSRIVDARAQLVWGEEPDRVRRKLMKKGMSKRRADHVIDVVMAEVRADNRKKAIRDILIGVVGMLIGYYFVFGYDGGATSTRGFKAIGFMGFIGIAGIFMFAKGLFGLNGKS